MALICLCVGVVIGIVIGAWPKMLKPDVKKEPIAYDAKGRPIYEKDGHKVDFYA